METELTPLLRVRAALADEAAQNREAVARIETVQLALDAMIASVQRLESRLARMEADLAAQSTRTP